MDLGHSTLIDPALNFLSTNLYSHVKMKLNFVKTCKNEAKVINPLFHNVEKWANIL